MRVKKDHTKKSIFYLSKRELYPELNVIQKNCLTFVFLKSLKKSVEARMVRVPVGSIRDTYTTVSA